MRIAFVTPEYITEENFDGGLANHLGRVCPILVEKGHQVIVIVASNQAGTIFQDGVEIHRVIISNFKGPFWLNGLILKRLKEVKKWIKQSWALNQTCADLHKIKRFDLIQYTSHTAIGLFSPKSVPSVIRLSSYEPILQRAYLAPHSFNNRLKAYLEKHALLRADAIFGPSKLIAEVVMKDTGIPVQVIEPPFPDKLGDVDLHPFQDLLTDKRYLLFFGTLGIPKGVLSIAEIIAPLLSTYTDLFFVFIGKDGGYHNNTMMEHIWKKAGSFRGRVLYLGQMPYAHLHPILSHATAVVLPSRIDNLPNACIEAMACKRIVIATKGASFEQLIEDGVSGFLISIDSPTELLIAIKKVFCLSVAERISMGERAGNRIAMLNPEFTVNHLVSFYRSAITTKLG